MNCKAMVLGAAVAFGAVAADPAFATTLLGPLDDPTGVSGLVVNGTTFEVRFTGLETYDQAFASAQPYYLNDLFGAIDASKALAAFLNAAGATEGVTEDEVEIALAKSPGTFQSEFVQYDFTHPAHWIAGGLGSLDTLPYRWAVFSVAQTPIPGALPLFASALGALGFAGWRLRQAGAA